MIEELCINIIIKGTIYDNAKITATQHKQMHTLFSIFMALPKPL